jgi:hypothetical protein
MNFWVSGKNTIVDTIGATLKGLAGLQKLTRETGFPCMDPVQHACPPAFPKQSVAESLHCLPPTPPCHHSAITAFWMIAVTTMTSISPKLKRAAARQLPPKLSMSAARPAQ